MKGLHCILLIHGRRGERAAAATVWVRAAAVRIAAAAVRAAAARDWSASGSAFRRRKRHGEPDADEDGLRNVGAGEGVVVEGDAALRQDDVAHHPAQRDV